MEFKKKLELSYYNTKEIKPNNEDQTKDLEKRKVVLVKASELYNKLLNIYKTQYNQLIKAQKKWIKVQNVFENLPFDLYLYKDEDENKEKSTDEPPMPPLKGDEEEIKEGKGLKILTPNKLLTRLPILLTQMKAGNNSYKLKNEIRQVLYLLYQHKKVNLIKSL